MPPSASVTWNHSPCWPATVTPSPRRSFATSGELKSGAWWTSIFDLCTVAAISAADAGSAPAHSSPRPARRRDRRRRLRRTAGIGGSLVEGEVRRSVREYEPRWLGVTSRHNPRILPDDEVTRQSNRRAPQKH